MAKRLMISRSFSTLFHFVTRELAGLSRDGGGGGGDGGGGGGGSFHS